MSKTAGLYIHIPFCRTRCGYCNFYSVTNPDYIPNYLKCLFKEMGAYRRKFSRFDTVYIGGGTPSLLDIRQLQDIIEKIQENFILLSGAEITIEINPADMDISALKTLKDMGVNRLNIGIQSLDPKILTFLERRHTTAQAVSAIETSRGAGFDNLGLDLIYGVPGQNMKSWMDTLTQVLSFRPEHLSCYQLTIEPETPLGKRHQKGDIFLPGEKLGYDFFMKTAETLEDAGYTHYEVSSFAKNTTFFSRHNRKYWEHTPYLGLGPTAHSFIDNRRWWNHRSLERYITDIEAGRSPVEETESLTMEQLRLEAIHLGLCTKKGIHLKDFAREYDYDLIAEKGEILKKLEEEGLIAIQNGYLYPTRAGLAVADSLSLI
ncbi:MAG: radical SAM family heme chaperone HemW [Proteobacteria bacterium]|nr:radical SAM family heme chaperone HemW [Pseudomonadota bacterium]